MEIKFTGVSVHDNGFGLCIEGYGKLEDIISVAMGTRTKVDRFSDFENKLPSFLCNNCDITVTITPHYPTATINGENAEKFLEGQYERIKKIAEASKED
jgi:hypothetical protein